MKPGIGIRGLPARVAAERQPAGGAHPGGHALDAYATSGVSPPDKKRTAIQPILDRVRTTDIWVVTSGKSPAHRATSLTDEHLKQHFAGNYKIGFCPIQRGSSTTRIALFDLDSHKGESTWAEMVEAARRLIEAATMLGIVLIPFRSSGGSGIHLIAIWNAEQDARSVRATMVDILTMCGFANGTRGVKAGQVEIFPKQDSVPADGWGSMFVVPGSGESAPLDPETLDVIDWADVDWDPNDPVPSLPPAEHALASSNEYGTPEFERVRGALFSIDPNTLDYDDWLRHLFAVHAATNASDEGLSLILEWSAQWRGFDPVASAAETGKQWRAARIKPGGIGAGTLFKAAGEAGWRDPAHAPNADGLEVLAGVEGMPAEVIGDGGAPAVNVEGVDPTEDAIAAAMETSYGDRLKFVHDAGLWRLWSGRQWVDDRVGALRHQIRMSARKAAIDSRSAGALGKARFVAGVEQMMRSAPAIRTTMKDWDADPMRLGVPSGSVDLSSGALAPADASLLLSKSTAVDPAAPGSVPARWLAFLRETCGGDEDVIRFLQKLFGYALTGKTTEQLLAFIYGEGGNGKGVLVDTVRGIFGGYGHAADMKLFAASKYEGHPTSLAALAGARLVTASETERGQAWAEARIKQLTGGDPITAHFMRQDGFTFEPQFQLVLVGNHRPRIGTIDKAIRRRLVLIEFNHRPTVVNPRLKEELRGEWPVILRWMIDGCLLWQAEGIEIPEAVRHSTEEYFESEDAFGSWLDENCEVGKGFSEPGSALFKDWSSYAKAVGYEAGTLSSFGTELGRRGFGVKKDGRGTKRRTGLRLLPHGSRPMDGSLVTEIRAEDLL